jgi:hypothetical protein
MFEGCLDTGGFKASYIGQRDFHHDLRIGRDRTPTDEAVEIQRMGHLGPKQVDHRREIQRDPERREFAAMSFACRFGLARPLGPRQGRERRQRGQRCQWRRHVGDDAAFLIDRDD